LKFRWQFIPQYTTFILDRPLCQTQTSVIHNTQQYYSCLLTT